MPKVDFNKTKTRLQQLERGKHKWFITMTGVVRCAHCGAIMDNQDAKNRLTATEELSAEDANIAYDNLAELMKTGKHPVCLALRAYAERMEA